MTILTLNIGSGSQHCSLYRVDGSLPEEPPEPLWIGAVESTFPEQAADEKRVKISGLAIPEHIYTCPAETPAATLAEKLISSTWSGPQAILAGPAGVNIAGHRIVHGGPQFSEAARIDAGVEAAIKRFAAFSPLHNQISLEGIHAARRLLGKSIPQFAIFDTSFHLGLPAAAATYAGPFEWLGKGIRRYGFHGTSFKWASHRAAQLLHREGDASLRLILCHLGGGCSLAATVGGRSLDTTMGFTPLDGIAMCTRSGAVDPGILFYLLREGASTSDLEILLNQESGLKGLSGLPGDTRVIHREMERGHERARLAMEVFLHRLKAGIGQMLASLGAMPDALVFTDAISEDDPWIRARTCEAFGFLGLKLDESRNAESPMDADIARPDSSLRVLLIRGREDWEIARQCFMAIDRPAPSGEMPGRGQRT